ncbi:hypothetical protein ACVWZN_001576 [Lysobacter sp. HA35]
MGFMLALLGPVLALFLGTATRRLYAPSCRAVASSAAGVLSIAALVVVASTRFPGPAINYLQGSLGWLMRAWLISPGMRLLLALPSVLAFAGAAAPQHRFRLAVAAGILAYASMVPLALVLLFVGCNYAGACF